MQGSGVLYVRDYSIPSPVNHTHIHESIVKCDNMCETGGDHMIMMREEREGVM